MIRRCLLALTALLILLLPACGKTETVLQDGYYTAEESDFDSEGWKKFITIYVSDNTILTVEYDAKDRSGFLKSWDMDYMRSMVTQSATYPNEYIRSYAVSLLNAQSPNGVEAISGATHSYNSFYRLAHAAIAKSRDGDVSVAYVELTDRFV